MTHALSAKSYNAISWTRRLATDSARLLFVVLIPHGREAGKSGVGIRSMAKDKIVRGAMLRDIYARTNADPAKYCSLADVLTAPKTEDDDRRILSQLVNGGLVAVEHLDSSGNGRVRITIDGIYEVEKMDERVDIVEQVENTLRKHPITGWTILLVIGFGIIATIVNQIVSVFKVFGCIN